MDNSEVLRSNPFEIILDAIVNVGGKALMIAGIIMLIYTGVRLVTKLNSGPHADAISFGSIFGGILIGGFAMTTGFSMSFDEPSEVEAALGDASSSATPTTQGLLPSVTTTTSPLPSTAVSPSAAATAEPTSDSEGVDGWLTPRLDQTDAGSATDYTPALQMLGTLALSILALLILVWVGYRVYNSIHNTHAEKKRRLLTEKSARNKQMTSWDAFRETHRQLTDQVIATETDWDTMFSRPALADATIPIVGRAWDAYMALGDMDDEFPQLLPLDAVVSDQPYPKAVSKARVAWTKAVEYADRVGMNAVPKEERRTITRIEKLLKLASDSGASPNERQLAYKQVEDLARTLISVKVPRKAMQQLELETSKVRTITRDKEVIDV